MSFRTNFSRFQNRDERGTVSFLGLCLMTVMLLFGTGLLYAAKQHQQMVGETLWETRLELTAEGQLNKTADEIIRDGAAAENHLPLEAEICWRDVTQDSIQVQVYARRTERGIFLLALSQGQDGVIYPGTHKQRQAYLVKETEGKYEWGWYLP